VVQLLVLKVIHIDLQVGARGLDLDLPRVKDWIYIFCSIGKFLFSFLLSMHYILIGGIKGLES